MAIKKCCQNNYSRRCQLLQILPALGSRVNMCLMPYANNKGADQPAHVRRLISLFVVRCLDSIMPLVSISKISRF